MLGYKYLAPLESWLKIELKSPGMMGVFYLDHLIFIIDRIPTKEKTTVLKTLFLILLS